MKQIIFSLISILFFSSCAVHSGIITGNASINDSNFRIVGLAVGQASTKQIFGIGGLKKDALTLEAKRNLYKNYPLQQGQALANVTVDYKRSFFPVICKTEAIVSAEIVDFNSTNNNSNSKPLNDCISLGNKPIIFLHKDDLLQAKILSQSSNKKTLLFENQNGNYKIKKIKNNKIYHSSSYSSEFKLNDEVLFQKSNKKQIGNIIATNKKGVIIEYNKTMSQKAFYECTYINLILAKSQHY
ncbi:DUF6567 family protein [Carboxylicivirga linearis]|uniref:Lipoprotein n=1 Tax=Carboxylicivirga linearis TaxID=1628157 RepID=A0ABS5JVK4_9BACT|nr:DUF6567 family protein [Carboxylicivirga linearis]MBS2098810.1 hypothetical protein [Carboxylicivirga linearis]